VHPRTTHILFCAKFLTNIFGETRDFSVTRIQFYPRKVIRFWGEKKVLKWSYLEIVLYLIISRNKESFHNFPFATKYLPLWPRAKFYYYFLWIVANPLGTNSKPLSGECHQAGQSQKPCLFMGVSKVHRWVYGQFNGNMAHKPPCPLFALPLKENGHKNPSFTRHGFCSCPEHLLQKHLICKPAKPY
jgi:hypothetical protein